MKRKKNIVFLRCGDCGGWVLEVKERPLRAPMELIIQTMSSLVINKIAVWLKGYLEAIVQMDAGAKIAPIEATVLRVLPKGIFYCKGGGSSPSRLPRRQLEARQAMVQVLHA